MDIPTGFEIKFNSGSTTTTIRASLRDLGLVPLETILMVDLI